MTETYILGGYTKGRNQGISSLDFDPVTGHFSEPQLIAKLNQPTFLAYAKESGTLFALHRGQEESGLVAFRHQGKDWQEVSRLLNTKIPGCHLAVHEASQTVYVANYHEGSVDSYHYDQAVLSPFERHEHVGSSVHPNQASAHIHFVGLNPEGDLLYVCDLGSDKLYVYDVTPSSGALSLVQTFTCPPGTGPRHLVFHPSQNLVYVIGELANSLLTLALDSRGQLSLVHEQALLNPEYLESAASAAIRISQDGRFLYTSSRFHDVICVFSLADPKQPLKIQEIASGGKIPRDFVLSQDQTYLLVPHQDSDHIAVFSRDADSGLVSFIEAETLAPECVCIYPI